MISMIVPLLGETGWARTLEQASAWIPNPVPTVVVAPHPDDETLAAGGLIAALTSRGIPVTVVAVTDGEHAYA